MKKGLKDWNFESPSRIRSQMGKTIGDDLCAPIPRDIRAPGLEVSQWFLSYQVIFFINHTILMPSPPLPLPFFHDSSASTLHTAAVTGKTPDFENLNVCAVLKENKCPVELVLIIFYHFYRA